jgi:hypothetical protein
MFKTTMHIALSILLFFISCEHNTKQEVDAKNILNYKGYGFLYYRKFDYQYNDNICYFKPVKLEKLFLNNYSLIDSNENFLIGFKIPKKFRQSIEKEQTKIPYYINSKIDSNLTQYQVNNIPFKILDSFFVYKVYIEFNGVSESMSDFGVIDSLSNIKLYYNQIIAFSQNGGINKIEIINSKQMTVKKEQ